MTTVDDSLSLGGFPVARSTKEAVIEKLTSLLNTSNQLAFFFANTNFIVKCQSLQNQMEKQPTLIVNDGVGVDIATWLIHHKKFPANLNGTDLIPHFLNAAKNDARVFLLGAKPGIALRAAKRLSRDYGVRIVGCADGYEQSRDTHLLIESINASSANVLLVAMGNPYQEQWIVQNREKLSVNILLGVGALLDFLAGDKPRAPALIQKLRLEWAYRLLLEPSRLARRYTIDIVIFLRICFRARNKSFSG